MFHKHHFFSLLALLAVFAIFFLNYFDAVYIRFVMLILVISVIFDLVWVFLDAGEYWSPNSDTQHSRLQYGFLKFIIFMVIILAFLKVHIFITQMVIAAILFKYRANPENISKQLSLLGVTFPLTGTPDSPVALIMSGRQTPAHASYAGY